MSHHFRNQLWEESTTKQVLAVLQAQKAYAQTTAGFLSFTMDGYHTLTSLPAGLEQFNGKQVEYDDKVMQTTLYIPRPRDSAWFFSVSAWIQLIRIISVMLLAYYGFHMMMARFRL